MNKLRQAAFAVAAIFGACALIHLPYNILTKAHIISSTPAWRTVIAFVGIVICLSEVIFFAYMARSKESSKCLKLPAFMVLIVPAISALIRIGNYTSGQCACFAEWWKSGSDFIGVLSPIISIWAVIWLIVLGFCFRRNKVIMVMSFVAAYETLFSLVLWTFLAGIVTVPPYAYTLILAQYYVVWTLFYVAIGAYYKKIE